MLLPGSHGQNMALTVSCVSSSLEDGGKVPEVRDQVGEEARLDLFVHHTRSSDVLPDAFERRGDNLKYCEGFHRNATART